MVCIYVCIYNISTVIMSIDVHVKCIFMHIVDYFYDLLCFKQNILSAVKWKKGLRFFWNWYLFIWIIEFV